MLENVATILRPRHLIVTTMMHILNWNKVWWKQSNSVHIRSCIIRQVSTFDLPSLTKNLKCWNHSDSLNVAHRLIDCLEYARNKSSD